VKIALKNAKVHKAMSQEITCFSGTLHVDGKKATSVENRGTGGSHIFLFLDHAIKTQVSAWADCRKWGSQGGGPRSGQTTVARHPPGDCIQCRVMYEEKGRACMGSNDQRRQGSRPSGCTRRRLSDAAVGPGRFERDHSPRDGGLVELDVRLRRYLPIQPMLPQSPLTSSPFKTQGRAGRCRLKVAGGSG
jgi:hypothetical protein